MVVSHSTVILLLSLDFLHLTSSQKDAFCATLVVLASASQVIESKVFILDSLAQTSFFFPSLDCAMKSSMEISSKLDALIKKKVEFEHMILAKDDNLWKLSELGNEYDA